MNEPQPFEEDRREAAPNGQDFRLDLDGYEGPIDVLLQLAREQKVDLTRISILAQAEQYLSFVRAARHLRLELAADYLVMAAWLAYLKSRLLLPEDEAGEEPSGAEMAAALRSAVEGLEPGVAAAPIPPDPDATLAHVGPIRPSPPPVAAPSGPPHTLRNTRSPAGWRPRRSELMLQFGKAPNPGKSRIQSCHQLKRPRLSRSQPRPDTDQDERLLRSSPSSFRLEARWRECGNRFESSPWPFESRGFGRLLSRIRPRDRHLHRPPSRPVSRNEGRFLTRGLVSRSQRCAPD